MYGFPTNTERRNKWLAQGSRSNLTITKDYNKKICEVIIFKNCIWTFSQTKTTPSGSLMLSLLKNKEQKKVCKIQGGETEGAG